MRSLPCLLGAETGRNRADIGAGLTLSHAETGLNLHVNYRGEHGRETNRNDVLVGVSYNFK